MYDQDINDKPADGEIIDVQPNSEDFQVRGQVKVGKGVKLERIKQHLDYGKWTLDPARVLTGPGENNWMAQGKQATATGAVGYTNYKAPEDAVFTVYFYDPYSGNNDAYVFCTGADCKLYEFSTTPVPKSGKVITPVYTINKKSEQPDDPDAENRICKGQTVIGEGVNLHLRATPLKHGKWDVNPAATITGPYDGSFLARGREATALGVEGSAVYVAPNAEFWLDFNVPYTKDNSAGIRCIGTECESYVYSVSPVPLESREIDPVYSITKKTK